MDAPSDVALVTLRPGLRERAVPIVQDSFVGIYRWHAKRTLREAGEVRAAVVGGELRAVAMLERPVPEVGYVYYLAVLRAHRRRGLGARLLDDALGRFARAGAAVVYAAAEEENLASIALFRSRGFRTVERKELGYREGGLGAWGLRSRMRIVHGEVLLGKRIRAAAPPTAEGGGCTAGGSAGDPRGGGHAEGATSTGSSPMGNRT